MKYLGLFSQHRHLLIFADMVYPILKIWAQLALWCFTKKITLHPAASRHLKGPLLLASNHPNSFLDAIVVGCKMRQPVHFITRGDVFARPGVAKFLESLNMIPIFRQRDGKDNLAKNDQTTTKSVEVLRRGGLLIIFVEGFCENQTTLQLPLKKGAGRILQTCWHQNIPATVVPLWLQYSSHRRYAKSISIRLGQVFGSSHAAGLSDAAGILKINAEAERQLQQLSAAPFQVPYGQWWLKGLLLVPAMLAAVLHAPLYLPVHAAVRRINKAGVFHDSLLLLFLMLLYPLYLLLICGGLHAITGSGAVWWGFLVLPLLARLYTVWR
jgi:1-acyl-sn-glycerol-3-phosphate acyltransferase